MFKLGRACIFTGIRRYLVLHRNETMGKQALQIYIYCNASRSTYLGNNQDKPHTQSLWKQKQKDEEAKSETKKVLDPQTNQQAQSQFSGRPIASSMLLLSWLIDWMRGKIKREWQCWTEFATKTRVESNTPTCSAVSFLPWCEGETSFPRPTRKKKRKERKRISFRPNWIDRLKQHL